METKHQIHASEIDGRICWECSCGMGGSYPVDRAGKEEDHIPPGEPRSYVSEPRW